MKNPYYARYLTVGGGYAGPDFDKWFTVSMNRPALVKEFAWAIPNDEAITELVCRSPIVEMGAGSGYWARLVAAAGGDIVAFDVAPPGVSSSAWHSKQHFHVRSGDPEVLSQYTDRALFLCWPPYSDDMAEACLEHYRGRTIIYVGEDRYGCTATESFHEELIQDFRELKEISLPQWPGIHDSMRIFERRSQTESLS